MAATIERPRDFALLRRTSSSKRDYRYEAFRDRAPRRATTFDRALLVDSTTLATRLDPEEWREVVAAYHHVTAEAITRFGGHVAHYFGDGVMADFGWPEAYDNNAERAARASLAILDAISKLNEHDTRPKLSARVEIDSGAVVVGASAGKSADVFGETPNIAQAAAAPGTVLITAGIHRLLSGLFIIEDQGAQVVKGIERPARFSKTHRSTQLRKSFVSCRRSVTTVQTD